ncbi:hypothetical protein EW145_g7326, partial [Phellinidium pouzarii]
MSSQHVFDSPDGLVLKALRGAVALNPALRLHAPSKSVYIHSSPSQHSNAHPRPRVALVSGGGAGHEPAHASYTGNGMLTVSVSGDIFASPAATQITTAIRLAAAIRKTSDVLLVVNNYTGDRLNFGLAAERVRGAGGEGLRLATVAVADDVALCDRPSLVGARGLAGNILVCKILGAAADSASGIDGAPLSLAVLKRLG